MRRSAFTLTLVVLAISQAHAALIQIGSDASNYGLLFEGAGGNNLSITNVTVNGNVGVGQTGVVQDGGPSTIVGRLDFSAGNTGQFHNNNASNVLTGGVHYNVAAVTSALTSVNGLNSTLGAESGTNITIHNSTTINASSGTLDATGDRVFDVTSFNTTNSDVITINGDAAGDAVVVNFLGLSANFDATVVLNNLTPDQVLWNFVGGSNLTGGPTLAINNNASGAGHAGLSAKGIFLNPNGAISVVNANVVGRVFGGDTHDFQYVSGANLTSPTGTTGGGTTGSTAGQTTGGGSTGGSTGGQVPEPSTIMLLGSLLTITLANFRKKATRS
jgi:hypothetical protein